MFYRFLSGYFISNLSIRNPNIDFLYSTIYEEIGDSGIITPSTHTCVKRTKNLYLRNLDFYNSIQEPIKIPRVSSTILREDLEGLLNEEKKIVLPTRISNKRMELTITPQAAFFKDKLQKYLSRKSTPNPKFKSKFKQSIPNCGVNYDPNLLSESINDPDVLKTIQEVGFI